jgi:hypothetical protein
MPLLILHAFLLAGVWAASTVRRETTVLRGGTVLVVHALLLTLQVVLVVAAALASVGSVATARGAAVAAAGVDSVAAASGGAGWSHLGGGAGLVALAWFATLSAAALPLRDTWLLSGFDDVRFGSLLEQSLGQLRIPFERDASGYVLTLGTTRARVAIRSLGATRAVVRFESYGTPPKKLGLLRSLLAKRLGRLVPRPRIRFD